MTDSKRCDSWSNIPRNSVVHASRKSGARERSLHGAGGAQHQGRWCGLQLQDGERDGEAERRDAMGQPLHLLTSRHSKAEFLEVIQPHQLCHQNSSHY